MTTAEEALKKYERFGKFDYENDKNKPAGPVELKPIKDYGTIKYEG